MTLAERMRSARKRAGLTQLQLAGRLERRPELVSRWERGLSEPSFTDAVALAEALSVPLSWLAGIQVGAAG